MGIHADDALDECIDWYWPTDYQRGATDREDFDNLELIEGFPIDFDEEDH